MDTHGLALGTALAVVGHSSHPGQYHLLVDSALGIGVGVLVVVGYVLLLRWRDDRGEESETTASGRESIEEESGQ